MLQDDDYAKFFTALAFGVFNGIIAWIEYNFVAGMAFGLILFFIIMVCLED